MPDTILDVTANDRLPQHAYLPWHFDTHHMYANPNGDAATDVAISDRTLITQMLHAFAQDRRVLALYDEHLDRLKTRVTDRIRLNQDFIEQNPQYAGLPALTGTVTMVSDDADEDLTVRRTVPLGHLIDALRLSQLEDLIHPLLADALELEDKELSTQIAAAAADPGVLAQLRCGPGIENENPDRLADDQAVWEGLDWVELDVEAMRSLLHAVVHVHRS